MKCEEVVRPPKSKTLKSCRILLGPGEDIGEHVTEDREEILVILKGTATLVYNGKEVELAGGESFFVNSGIRHNVKNLKQDPLEYVYVVAAIK